LLQLIAWHSVWIFWQSTCSSFFNVVLLSFYYEEQIHLSAAIAIDDGNALFVDSTYSFEDLGAAFPSIMRYEVD
jgi:hypothetical protein